MTGKAVFKVHVFITHDTNYLFCTAYLALHFQYPLVCISRTISDCSSNVGSDLFSCLSNSFFDSWCFHSCYSLNSSCFLQCFSFFVSVFPFCSCSCFHRRYFILSFLSCRNISLIFFEYYLYILFYSLVYSIFLPF